jgi:hypothetical protein
MNRRNFIAMFGSAVVGWGNQNLIRVAVAHHPREAIPLQGTWFGTASDHLAMNVAVKVTAAGLPALEIARTSR